MDVCFRVCVTGGIHAITNGCLAFVDGIRKQLAIVGDFIWIVMRVYAAEGMYCLGTILPPSAKLST